MTNLSAYEQYQQHLTQMQHIMKYGKIDRIQLLQRVLHACGDPDQDYPIIHVCGTNGKGSTCLIINKLLQQTGLKVGWFSSPAIDDDREMIQVNDTLISYEDFNAVFKELEIGLKKIQLQLTDLSTFEIWFVLAVLHFARQQVNYTILECGLGGEFDATNAIHTAVFDIFTHIDLDHEAILGHTIEAIAITKSKIIRPGAFVVDYPDQYASVSKIIQAEARRKNANYHSAREVKVILQHSDLSGTDVILTKPFSGKYHLGLLGQFQVENLRTVLAFVPLYNQRYSQHLITSDILMQTLPHLKLKGRLEKIATDPPIFLEGGHNPDGVGAIAKLLQQVQVQYHLILILGFLKDKNIPANLAKLKVLKADLILTTPDNPQRAEPAATLAHDVALVLGKNNFQVIPDAMKALNVAKRLARQVDRPLIMVLGSFYLVKAVDLHE